MRTRIFNKMTAKEVEDYLTRGGDTIFVPVGVVECHSAMPIDVEQMVPEAYALLMAERADGLAMVNLPYFFPGGTVVSSSTVQVTVRQAEPKSASFLSIIPLFSSFQQQALCQFVLAEGLLRPDRYFSSSRRSFCNARFSIREM